MPLTRPRTVEYPHIARFATAEPTTQAADIAIPIDVDGVHVLAKGSAGAYSVAAPGNNIGRRITFLTSTDFAHVVTFTGSTLRDGTTGVSITWTAAAFAGSALTVRAFSATIWLVESMNLGAIA
jgi:hypothetical protein